jgi:PTS system mannose-specific IIB component/fructoselysine and glucoselysine-specific PTS system IIB component
MPIVLYRVDDRLVHGQVVIGWGRPLGVGLIILVDDGVADSPWEQDLYRMGVTPEIELRFAHVAEVPAGGGGWAADPRPTIVLTSDVATMAAVCRVAGPVAAVNLGGLHHKPGRTSRLPYIFLSEEDLRLLNDLEHSGTAVSAQDLPTTSPVALEQLR